MLKLVAKKPLLLKILKWHQRVFSVSTMMHVLEVDASLWQEDLQPSILVHSDKVVWIRSSGVYVIFSTASLFL